MQEMKMHWALFFTLVLKTIAAPTSHEKRQHIIDEAKDIKNTWGESRPAQNTDTIDYEVPGDCEKLEERCTEINEPVCGTDGLTHRNKCKLKLSSCYKPEDNVTIAHEGECVRENDSDGCWYHVLNKVLPYGTKGYEKCLQMECQQDKSWHPTGERLLNCDVGSVKCWNWVTNETAPLESTMDFECNQYLCTVEDWELNGERKSCEGCLSVTSNEYLPHGFDGYWKCEQFECLRNNSWQETGERLPGCSVGEVKCWDWNLDATVPLDSEMLHNNIKFICTEDDWQQISIYDSSSPAVGSMACFNWQTKESVPIKSTMYFECNHYLCTEENEWVIKGNRNISCETEGCLSMITNEVEPYDTKGYYKCEQFECLRNNTWHNTGVKLSSCSSVEMKCLHWYNNEIVPIGSVIFHNCNQYICSDNDWKKTANIDPSCIAVGSMACFNLLTKESVHIGSTIYFECNHYVCTEENEWVIKGDRNISCETEGCWSMITNEVEPYETKGYFKCEQFECLRNNTWHNTGEKLAGCSPSEMKCLDWYNNEIVPIGSVMFHKCTQYMCSENDWKITPNSDPSCIAGTVTCWNVITKESLPVNSTAYFECYQYICTEQDDWKQTWKRDPACGETNGCWTKVTQEEVPYGYKGYYDCEQFECTENWDWKKTGERLSGCSVGKFKCWDWHQDAAVPVNSVFIHKNIQYTCTEKDWEKKTIQDPSSLETGGCLSMFTKEVVPYDHKGYYLCEQFECLRNKTWHKTGEKLSACSNGEVKCWNWNLGAAVPINSALFHNNNQYECTEEDWTPLPELAVDEPAIIPEYRFDAGIECVPGVTSEHDGQQCCCSDEAILDCNGPCPEQELTTMSKMDEPELTTMSKMEEPELTTMSEMEEPELTTMSEMEEPELTTKSEMETTTKDSSSSKKEISLLLFLLSAALFWI